MATNPNPRDDGAPDPADLHEAIESMPDGPNVAPSPRERQAAEGDARPLGPGEADSEAPPS